MKRISVIIICLLGLLTSASAQCKVDNTAFQAGEKLTYKLYFNWKFVWLNAGSATLSTTETKYKDETCYRSHLITRTSTRLDKFFRMRDTLVAITSYDMVPRYYRKAANEGNKYYVDQVWYSYPNGKIHLDQDYLNRHGEDKKTTYDGSECIYDMLSMMMRARSYDANDFKVGQKLVFPMADGDEVKPTTLIYRGKKEFKMEDTKVKYRCLVFSFVEYDSENKEKEIITFYVTDDNNHMPVRLDLFLKFGTAKAFLTNATGLRNASTSIINK